MDQGYWTAPQVDPREVHKQRRLAVTVVGVLGAIVLVCGLSGYFCWRAFLGFGFRTDLDDYEASIRDLNLDPVTKNELLARIDALQEKARGALPMGIGKWIEHDEAIRGTLDRMAGAEPIDPVDVQALRREIGKLEQAFGIPRDG